MNNRTHTKPEIKNNSVAHNSSVQKHNHEPAAQFTTNSEKLVTDNFQGITTNSQTIKQLKEYHDMANNSQQVKKLFSVQRMADDYFSNQEKTKDDPGPIQKKENTTGLPDQLKSGVEQLSGFSMDDVKVHYNSDKPAQLQALAYAQGADIHIAGGEEKHLAHEAWHVVQQKQGRVKPTVQLKDVNINDDRGLEHEADVMGAKALNHVSHQTTYQTKKEVSGGTIEDPCQLVIIKPSEDAPVQRVLFVNDAKVEGDKDKSLEGLGGPEMARAVELIRSRGVFRFADAVKLKNWIARSLDSVEFAKTLHERLYYIIKTDILSQGGTIAESTFSTTGVLFPGDGTLEVACNFAVTPKGAGKPVGRDVTLDEVVKALNLFPGGSPLDLGPSILKVHNAASAIHIPDDVENDKLSKLQLRLVETEWAAALTKAIGDSWPSFAVHADVILAARAKTLGLNNPVIGISKAPCELCHRSNVTGRKEDEGTGIKGNINLDLKKKQVPEDAQGEIQKIINALFNHEMGGYAHQPVTVRFEGNSQNFRIVIPRWIPPELLTYKTESADIMTIEVEVDEL